MADIQYRPWKQDMIGAGASHCFSAILGFERFFFVRKLHQEIGGICRHPKLANTLFPPQNVYSTMPWAPLASYFLPNVGARRDLDAMLSDAASTISPEGRKLQKTCVWQVSTTSTWPIGISPIRSEATTYTGLIGYHRPVRPVPPGIRSISFSKTGVPCQRE